MKKERVEFTYYRIDYKNCNLDYDYTIVPDLEDISDAVAVVELDLDEDDEAKVEITGIGMTKEEYQQFLESCDTY